MYTTRFHSLEVTERPDQNITELYCNSGRNTTVYEVHAVTVFYSDKLGFTGDNMITC